MLQKTTEKKNARFVYTKRKFLKPKILPPPSHLFVFV